MLLSSRNNCWFGFFSLILCLFVVGGCSTINNKDQSSKFKILVEKASSQYEMGLLTEAEASYRRVIELQPNYYESWLKLGNIYVRTGQLDAAVRMYRKCTDMKPNDVRGWSNLSLTRLKQSLEVLDEAKQYFPDESVDGEVLRASRKSLIEHLVQ